ncbi:MAG: Flp pilus assembly complex ATPase component TadA [Planctomycetaceae bacterium]|nr:Flp pilus assembly complex ATPase component TadA [Planctomycetaceae bacterium]
MIFGWGRKDDDYDDDEDEDEDEDDREYVLFQGALNGETPDLAANARLVQAGLLPAKQLVTEALERRAEMIRIEPKGKVAQVAFYIDGVPYPASRLPGQMAMAITQMLKLLCGLDPRERSKPQSGGANVEFTENKYVLKVDSAPVAGGAERLIIRAQDQKKVLEKPDDVGFSEELKAKIREFTSQKNGLLLAAGPPNSGVTTVSIAMARSVDAYMYSIYSLADLGDRDLAHVTSMKKNEGDTLSQTITRAKRKEADVCYVEPLLTAELAKESLEGSKECALIGEFPAKDAADAIARFCQLVGDPKAVAAQLRLVCSQKLVRVLCTKCKQAYRPNPKLLAKVGLPPETKVLYRPPRYDEEDEEDEDEEERRVCRRCGGLGYHGRTGMLEFIEVTEPIRKAIAQGANANQLRELARNEKMQSFQSEGLRLVVDGNTSLEELQRVFRSKD